MLVKKSPWTKRASHPTFKTSLWDNLSWGAGRNIFVEGTIALSFSWVGCLLVGSFSIWALKCMSIVQCAMALCMVKNRADAKSQSQEHQRLYDARPQTPWNRLKDSRTMITWVMVTESIIHYQRICYMPGQRLYESQYNLRHSIRHTQHCRIYKTRLPWFCIV